MAIDTVDMSVHAMRGDGRSVAAIAVCEVDCDHLRRVVWRSVAIGVWTHFLMYLRVFL